MNDSWRPLVTGPRRSVAIFNYNVAGVFNAERETQDDDSPWHLSFFVGELLVVIEESDQWFFGHAITNSAMCGIFPKSYVSLPTGGASTKSEPPIVSETTAALKEWNLILKQKYLEKDIEKLKLIQAIMREVLTMRSSLVASKLTVEEMKEIRQKVTTKMDFLNHRLGLDLVVRDCNEEVMTPEMASSVTLYRQHVLSSEKIKTMLLVKPRDEVEMTNSFKIILSVDNFVSAKLTETVDLIISIFEFSEGKTPKPLCENFIIENWNRNPSYPLDRSGFRVQFGEISKNDITNKRLYLICHVVTEGNFCGKSSIGMDSERKSAGKDINFRKPVGVSATDITDLFTFKQGKSNQQSGLVTEIACPFLAGNESDSWETTFRKLIAEKKVSEPKALWVKIEIVFGDASLNVVDHYNASFSNFHHHLTNRIMVARKLGLPEVILPSDVRNDLYITLIGGEFSRLDKRQDRNIELTVEACDIDGEVIHDCLSGGVSVRSSTYSYYRTVVYYHDGKPRWNEVVRLTVPADQFGGSHLRFTFRHKSRNDSKEKSAPWAMSFLKLVNESDGTSIKDGHHDLLVYKLDKKHGSDEKNAYLKLPHLRTNHNMKVMQKQTAGTSSGGLTLLSRDIFTVQTTLASTKLTQNEGLLSLLKWKSEPDYLTRNLKIFNQKVNGNEFVKFMPDVLDALFSILMENTESEKYDEKVFESLVNVLNMLTDDTRYQQFVPVLELYINNNFYATLAYNKLLIVLKECADNYATKTNDLSKTMKSLKYVFKFVVRSRTLCSQLNSGKGQEVFEERLTEVLQSLVKLMSSISNDVFQAQRSCLKHMVASIPDLTTVYNPRRLSEVLIAMILSLDRSHLNEEKIQTLKEIVQSQLFSNSECRAVILPTMVSIIRDFIEETDQTTDEGRKLVGLCTETLGDILDSLQNFDDCSHDVSVIVRTALRTIIQSVANRRKEDSNIQAVVANMISIFRRMTSQHYDEYIDQFNVTDPAGRSNLIDFVMEVLGMFRDLLQNNVFPDDWNTMIMLQNSVILKALCQVSYTIRDHLSSPFEYQAWNNFFQCAISFITQPSLQVERFSETKKRKVLEQHKDMRKEMGLEVRQMWFNLGHHKIDFVPDMVGPFLEMTLIPETELRRATIPIFFDMMQCEYYSSRKRTSTGEHYDTRRDSSMIKANFVSFEHELISRLDMFVAEANYGDEHYLYLFKTIMMTLCESHTLIKESGTRFVKTASRLMELLLEYRTISQQESKENQMSCCVHLLDFYHEIDRTELYVKYLKKLATLHEQCQNWAEAAFTILQYSSLLNWSDDFPIHSWKRHSNYRTHRALKEILHKDVIENFEKGQMWELALKVCKELAVQYEEVTFEYPKLSELLSKMSQLYNNIMTEMRPPPDYFRVAFYGRGFPAFLQNKVFIYRGRGFEHLSEFQARMLDQFPSAELMKSLQPPTKDEMESPKQLLQINFVEPVMEKKEGFQDKTIDRRILSYFKSNEVNKFCYSRPYHKSKDKDNEFASLWIERTVLQTRSPFPGILQWFPVAQPPEVFDLCPLEVAIENMEKTNEDLRGILYEHQNGNPPLNPLSMKLKGIIDAAVMGGTANYERAFFNDKYLDEHPDDEEKVNVLKDLIAQQIPLLHIGIRIHALKKSEDLKPFHDQLEAMFKTMQAHVEENYGKRRCDFTLKRVSNESSSNSEDRNCSQSESSRSAVDGRYTIQSQMSVDTSAMSTSSIMAPSKRVLSSVIGINRKKSNAGQKEDKMRKSFNSQSSIIRQSSPDIPSRVENGSRLCVIGSMSGGSRPSSGQFVLTSTPNHSRSPSITSNRDSLQSTEGGTLDPPQLPPKTSKDQLDASIIRRKKAPPPPPPASPKKSSPRIPE